MITPYAVSALCAFDVIYVSVLKRTYLCNLRIPSWVFAVLEDFSAGHMALSVDVGAHSALA